MDLLNSSFICDRLVIIASPICHMTVLSCPGSPQMTGVYLSETSIMTKRNATVRACAALFLAFAAASMTGCAGLKQDAAATAAAAQSADLSTFYKLAQQAELGDVLNGSSPVTIFAPTNEAFQALPPATLDKLAKDPAQLKALLSHHIVAGKISAANITENTVLNTVGGSKLNVSKAGEFITLDDAMVTQADVASSNGIVHKIDRVLTPPAPKK